MTTIKAADLFCGAGGASTGLVRACAALGLELELLAINHWPIAVATHSKNHPHVRHLCESVERIDPRAVVPGGRLHLLLAGPECTHFSTALGGRPVNPQSRASAWHILKWAQELYIDTILIENVPEFRTWGPIGADMKPLKSKRGETYRAFVTALQSLGYRVEDRILNAADYGDPTTRQRLFIMARRGQHRVSWPMATHSKGGHPTLDGARQRWRPARDVIDWTLTGRSIFHRKKPLKPKTLERIVAGLRKFGGPELQPFLVLMEHGGRLGSVDAPLPTITTARAGAIAVAQPFLVRFKGTSASHLQASAKDVNDPLATLTAEGGQFGLAQPSLSPFVLGQQSGAAARSVDHPLPTIATDGAISIVEPYLAKYYGSGDSVSPVSEPTPTVTTRDRFALVEPFILDAAHGSDVNCRAKSVDAPLGVVTGSNRFGLVQPVIDGYVLDIHFRMLQPHELSAAMSFPRSYVFCGNREETVKQIGNSWPGELSLALNKEVLVDYLPARRRAAWRAEKAS